MALAEVNNARLHYAVEGSGEPMLLVHGGIIADGMLPLLREPALAKRCQMIAFHRRGYGRSSQAVPPFAVADHARGCIALMDWLSVQQAHVVGHSFGGLIALQLASDAPERVRSLTLIEPSLLGLIPSASQIFKVFEALTQVYQSGDKQGAVHNWMLPISGRHYRQALDRVLPDGWFQQAVADIDTAFQVDVASLEGWQFGPSQVQRIQQPVLSVIGEDHSMNFAREVDALLRSWFPQAETLAVPGSMHWTQLTNPAALAEGLARFLARIPVSVESRK